MNSPLGRKAEVLSSQTAGQSHQALCVSGRTGEEVAVQEVASSHQWKRHRAHQTLCVYKAQQMNLVPSAVFHYTIRSVYIQLINQLAINYPL